MNALARTIAPELDMAAAAVYAAMQAPPPFVTLARALLDAPDRHGRDALLDAAEPTVQAAALRYLAEPEATREKDRMLAWMRSDVRRVAALRRFFSTHIVDFVDTYLVSTDPRLIAEGKPALSQIKLWPRQRELVQFILERWERGETGVVVKSRDIGASVISMAVLASLCIFRKNFSGGIASSVEVKLDRTGDPSTLFHKLRLFCQHLPPEFNGGFDIDRTSAYLRVSFPQTGSSVVGEAGLQIGRGARHSLVICDEFAHMENSAAIDASLAATANARIDISSVAGTSNSFYDKAHNAALPRFDFHWRSDPRKGDEWYAKQVASLDPVILAQEVDMDWHASTHGAIIPSNHVQAAIDLHLKLKDFVVSGKRLGALDVADEGKDRNAFAIRHGQLLESVQSWSGKGSDLYGTTQRAFRICDEHDLTEFLFDSDGLGAGVRGDAKNINDKRTGRDANGHPTAWPIKVIPYRGSSTPEYPGRRAPGTNRTNLDYFANCKAQAWHHLAMRFRESFKASRGEPFDAELIICIDSKIPDLSRLIAQFSQATSKETASGKLAVNKLGDGEKSPDLADAVVIAFAPKPRPLHFSDAALAKI